MAELRQRARLSQREMAKLVHISDGYPSAIESGRSRPEPDVLRNIAMALDANYDELAALAGYIPRPEGDQSVIASEDKAPILRRMLDYPLDKLREAEVWLRIVSTVPTPPEDQASEKEDDEEQRNA